MSTKGARIPLSLTGAFIAGVVVLVAMVAAGQCLSSPPKSSPENDRVRDPRSLLVALSRTVSLPSGATADVTYVSPELARLLEPGSEPSSELIFFVSENLHDGRLPETLPPVRLEVDLGPPRSPLRHEVLTDDPHHRRSRLAFEAPAHQPARLVLVFPSVSLGPPQQLAWELDDAAAASLARSVLVPYRTAAVVSVQMTDRAYVPPKITLRRGQPVIVTVENLGQAQHHLHVAGLAPQNLMWLQFQDHRGSPPPAAELRSAAMAPHHVCTSGLCPTGLDVHLHANPGEFDAIAFVPASSGAYRITCPLHAELTGMLEVV